MIKTETISQTSGSGNMWPVYMELGKSRLSAMVVITTVAGFFLAGGNISDFGLFFWTVLGTACTALGANSFNEWREIERDALMKRTRKRPLPSGKISATHAFVWSVAVSAGGFLLLLTQVNTITAMLALANILIYVMIYTPMKVHSSLCTIVGAVCGGIPPMMGWTAVTGELGYGAWVLGATLFIWQIPHFLALAWMYREDYERGGFRMLPSTDQSGQITCHVILLYSLALLPLGLAYFLGGLTGIPFLIGSLVMGSVFVWLSIRLYFERSDGNARRLFFASIIYLPLFFGLMMADILRQ